MTDTAQGYPGENLQYDVNRSTWQTGTPERIVTRTQAHHDQIEDALEGHTSQLTDRAHNISTRGVLTK